MATQIRSIRTTAGFLKNATVDFSPGLTCIIGARGTCKSTIVETIRFAFDCDAQRISDLISEPASPLSITGPSSKGLIRATLQGGIAKCTTNHLSASGATVV